MHMQAKPGTLIVVAPADAIIPFPAKKQVVNVTQLNRIFPAIHELQPGSIVLDYEFTGNDTEKILRRITSNPFYSKLKIYCYKQRENTKVDSLLRVLGVQHFIYGEDKKQIKVNAAVQSMNDMLEGAVANKLVEASY